MKQEITWPEIFDNPDLVKTSDPRGLYADAMMAWANCMSGSEPPKRFGDVLVAIAERIGMSKAATAENLLEHAKARGWAS
jgi:hypothetical protein